MLRVSWVLLPVHRCLEIVVEGPGIILGQSCARGWIEGAELLLQLGAKINASNNGMQLTEGGSRLNPLS